MVTPFKADGQRVHEPGVRQLVERLAGQGVHGILVGGTTGEVWALDDEQWALLVRWAVEKAAGRMVVYANISQASTAAAVERARLAERLGADAIVSLTPYYLALGQGEIVRHFQAVAAATALPVLIYQYPGIVKVTIAPPTLVELARIPNVVGMKDSLADVTEFRHLVSLLRSDQRDFRLFLGTDVLTDVVVLIGGQGTVPSLGNIGAAFMVEAYEAAVAGEWQRSAAAQAKADALLPVYRVAGETQVGGIIAGLKCALNMLGVEAGPTAPPLLPCDGAQTRAVEDILRKAGLMT